MPTTADSNPRITFGKYFNQNNKILLPLSVLVNHGLVDGIHLASFYNNIDEIIKELF